MIEREKKFLVSNIPNLTGFRHSTIKQGYISAPPSPLRIRQKDDQFELTKKLSLKEGNYSSAEEINLPLTESEFKKLWPLVENSLEKIRYYIGLEDGHIAELDIFDGPLKGLFLVEVEFASEAKMNSFQPPAWFGREVTGDAFSANSFLAGKTFEEIKDLIETMNSPLII